MMEHISEILKKTQINTSNRNTDTWSSAEAEPNSDCPICKGAGIIHPLLPSGKPDYSQVVSCRCVKKGLDNERQTRLQRYSNLSLLSRLTFDNFLPQGRSGHPTSQAQFKKVFEAARAFAAEPRGWFVLSGPSGSGKTHIAAAIANERLSHGHAVLYITTPDLLDHLRAAFKPGSEIPYDEFFDQVRNAQLLVLDDLGAQSGTPWAKEKLDQLLTYRFNSELPTVIVTITPVEQLEDRLRTRLSDPKLCQIHILEEKLTLLGYDWEPKYEIQKNMTFANFDYKRTKLTPEQRENLEGVFHAAFDFAQTSDDGWLVLQGVNGCGKTHLAAAIVNYRYQAKQPAKFVVVAEFLDHLRSTFRPESSVSYDQEFESVKTAPLLVLDDFGEQSSTPWAQEKLYQVINYRYNARLPTVITTTSTLDEIENRMGSRLVDRRLSSFLNITAPDYRSEQPSQRKLPRSRKGNWNQPA